jgi:hypothetical protein
MGYTPHEFQAAFDKTALNHSIVMSKARRVAEYFSHAWESNKRCVKAERRPFGELIRLTLNENGITAETERKAYSSLIGNLYSPHAHKAKKYQTANGVPKVKATPPPPRVIRTTSGQLAWEI